MPLSTGIPPVDLAALSQVQGYGLKMLKGSTDQESPAPPRPLDRRPVLLRQNVRGYQLGEIAHVENALKGEAFERTFRTTRRARSSG